MRLLAAVSLYLLLAAPASAVTGNDPISAWITDGSVYAVAATPQQVLVGGDFSLIGRETGSWVAVEPTGNVVQAPPALFATVTDAVSDGGRGWFLLVGDDDDETRVVHLRADRSIDPKWRLKLNGAVYAIGAFGHTLYVGGDFTKVNGERRLRLAAIDMRTQKLAPWRIDVAGDKPKSYASVSLVVPSAEGATIYLEGEFTRLGGEPRAGLGAVDAVSGKTTPWKPTVNGSVYTLVPHGGTVLLGGDFDRLDGIRRSEIGSVDARSGAVTAWDPRANGAISAIAPAGRVVYVGGTFTSVGGKSRRGLAALDAVSGNATPWDANTNGAVDAILPVGDTVYFGGSFDVVGGFPRANLAAATASNGAVRPWDPRSDRRVLVLRRGSVKNRILAGGEFDTVGAFRREGLAALSLDGAAVLPWVPPISGAVRALVFDPRSGGVFLGGRYRLDGDATQRSMAFVATPSITPWGGDFNAFVDAITLGPDGTVYAGGSFSTVQGKARKRLVALDPSGALATWNAGANGLITSLVLDGDQLYVGGNFTSIGGASRRGAAVLDTAGSSLATGWDAGLDGNVFALAQRDDILYLAGNFETIGTRPRNYLGSVFKETARPTTWDPAPDGYPYTLCLDPAGTLLYVGGEFGAVGRTDREAAEFDTTAGFLLGWRPRAPFDARACATSLDGSTLYLGGDGAFSVFR
jgi:Domain of unknown function (DUF5122) beta-propeller